MLPGATASTCCDDGWPAFLSRHGLSSAFADTPLAVPLGEAFRTFEHEGRPALLAKLKELGLAVLPLRQKLSNAIGKEIRERNGIKARVYG